MPTMSSTLIMLIPANFFTLLFNLSLAKGMAMIASVDTIRIHQVTKFPRPGSFIKIAKDSEKKIRSSDKIIELERTDTRAVE